MDNFGFAAVIIAMTVFLIVAVALAVSLKQPAIAATGLGLLGALATAIATTNGPR